MREICVFLICLTVFCLQNFASDATPAKYILGSSSSIDPFPFSNDNPFDDPFFTSSPTKPLVLTLKRPTFDPDVKSIYKLDPFMTNIPLISDPLLTQDSFKNDPFKNDPFFQNIFTPHSPSSTTSQSKDFSIPTCDPCDTDNFNNNNNDKGTSSSSSTSSDSSEEKSKSRVVPINGPDNESSSTSGSSSSTEEDDQNFKVQRKPPQTQFVAVSSTSVNNYPPPPTQKPVVTATPIPPASTSSSNWPVGAAAVGGAVAGGLLASAAASKPKPAVKPAPYMNQNNKKPIAKPANTPPKCDYCIRPNCRPTVKPYPNFNAKQDSETLLAAVKGLGTDEDTLINILTKRSDDQIQQIVNEYTKHGRSLAKDLAGDTSLKFKDMLMALVTPLPLFYAEELHKALKRLDSSTMIEILTSLSDCAIREISVEYGKKHKTPLPDKIKLRTNLDFEKFLLALAKGDRAKNKTPDVAAAKKDAQVLIDAGVSKWFGTDEATFIDIFSTRSFPQLREILKQYDALRKPKGKSIETDISSEFSDKLEKGLKTLVKNIKDQPSFFADELDYALRNPVSPWPMDGKKVIRIMRGRSGIDLLDIKENFDKRYKEPLAKRLDEKSYLEFRRLLLALLNTK